MRDFYFQPQNTFLICALLFGGISAFTVPQLSVNDENMHFLRAYNLASGSLGNTGCSYPEDIKEKDSQVYDNTFSADYSDTIDFTKMAHGKCGSAAGYTPIMHLPQAAGIFLAKIFQPSTASLVLWGRLFNLVFYSAALYFIIRKTRVGKWPLTVIGLFPIMIHTAGSLSADVMNSVICLGAAMFIINLYIDGKKTISNKRLAVLLSLFPLVALSKPTNTLILLLAATLPSTLFKNVLPHSRFLPAWSHKWLILLCGGILAILALLGWQYLYGHSITSFSQENLVKDNPLYFIVILSNTYLNPFLGYSDVVIRGVVGEFSSFRYHLPTFMVIVCFALFFISLLRGDVLEEKLIRKRIGVLGLLSFVIFCASLVLVSYAMYATWATQNFRLGPKASYADGVQGRYFTGLLVLFIPVGIWLRKYISINIPSQRLFSGILSISLTLCLVYYTIQTYGFLF